MCRSMLFVPGNTPNLIVNSNCMGADAIIFDLEDAVAPAEKDSARFLVRNAIKYMNFLGIEIVVRINSLDTSFWKEDLNQILHSCPDIIMLPKTSSASDVAVIANISETLKKDSVLRKITLKLCHL